MKTRTKGILKDGFNIYLFFLVTFGYVTIVKLNLDSSLRKMSENFLIKHVTLRHQSHMSFLSLQFVKIYTVTLKGPSHKYFVSL